MIKKLLSLYSSEGVLNAAIRVARSVLYRFRGGILLGWGCTSGPGLRIVGFRYISFKKTCSFGYHCRIEAYDSYRAQRFTPSISIGENSHFGDLLHVGAIGKIHIGDNVLFGSKILVIDHDHGRYGGEGASVPYMRPIDRDLCCRGDIYIGNNVWIGDNAMVFGGANIGEGSVIAAGALVTGIVPPGSICVNKNVIIKKFVSENKEWVKAKAP